MTLTKTQVRIAWIIIIILSIISFFFGWAMGDIEKRLLSVIFQWLVPILLIGGLMFFRSKTKI